MAKWQAQEEREADLGLSCVVIKCASVTCLCDQYRMCLS